MQSELFKPLSKPWQPHGYQKKAVKFLLEHAASALFLDPGLGKTSITLAAIKMLKQKKVLDKVLLIAPLRVCYSVWPKEVEKWEDFSGIRVCVLHGPNKDELLKQDADVYVINPEGLEWLLQVEKTKTSSGKTKVSVNLRRWKSFGFDTLVIDELSKFKHTNTNRFKALKMVLNTFRRRWGLTGSPASNGLMDLVRPVLRPRPRADLGTLHHALSDEVLRCRATTASTGTCVKGPRRRFTSAWHHWLCAWRLRTTSTCRP